MNETENRYQQGEVLLIDKPLGWTSFDVVKKVRRLTGAKTGHAGTLDPLATGLLICCTGRYTKRIAEYQAREKEYTGTITLGAVTPTFDLESTPRDFKPFDHLTPEDLYRAAGSFLGEGLQVPPAHSAIKQQGQPVYALARRGREVILQPRKVIIGTFDITRIEGAEVDFLVRCSTGTYIRSLAHDFGQVLGCGAHLSRLCRTAIGEFRLDDALSMEALQDMIGRSLRTDSPPQN